MIYYTAQIGVNRFNKHMYRKHELQIWSVITITMLLCFLSLWAHNCDLLWRITNLIIGVAK